MNNEITCAICGSATANQSNYCGNCGYAFNSNLDVKLVELPSPSPAARCSEDHIDRLGQVDQYGGGHICPIGHPHLSRKGCFLHAVLAWIIHAAIYKEIAHRKAISS